MASASSQLLNSIQKNKGISQGVSGGSASSQLMNSIQGSQMQGSQYQGFKSTYTEPVADQPDKKESIFQKAGSFIKDKTSSIFVKPPTIPQVKLPSGGNLSFTQPKTAFDLGPDKQAQSAQSAQLSPETQSQLTEFYSPQATAERRKRIQEQVEFVARDTKPGYKEPGVWGSVVESIKEATIGLGNGLGATAEMIGSMTQSILLTEAGQKLQKESQKILASNPEWKMDINEPWGVKKVARLTAGAVPSIIGVIGATLATAPIGGAGGPAFGFAIEGGPTYQEAINAGVSEEEAQKYGLLVGTVNGVLEAVFPLAVSGKKAGKEVVKELSESVGKTLLKKAKKFGITFAKDGTLEGTTEALQELWSNVIATNYDENRNLWDGLLEAFVGGFGAGGISGSVLESGEHTPQEVLDKVVNTPLQDTKEGKLLIKSALEAKERGENIVIGPKEDFTSVKDVIETKKADLGMTKEATENVVQADGEKPLGPSTISPKLRTSIKSPSDLVAGRELPSDSTMRIEKEPGVVKSTNQVLSSNRKKFLRDFSITSPSNSDYTKYFKEVKTQVKTFDTTVQDIASLVDGLILTRLKSQKSLNIKLERRKDTAGRTLANMNDTLAGTVITENIDQAIKIAKEKGITGIHDFRKEPTFLGYRGVHSDFELSNGLLSEIQFHTKEAVYRKNYAHEIYDKWRKYIENNGATTFDDVFKLVPTKKQNEFKKDVRLSNNIYSGKVKVPQRHIDNLIAKQNKVSPGQELSNYYSSQDQEAVGQAWYEVMAELEIAEAGSRIYDADGNITGGISSTFPDWVPEGLRTRKLFDSVLDGISDPTNLQFPPNSQPRKQALYEELLSEIDSRAGTNSGDIIERLKNAKETIKEKTKERVKKPVLKSVEGSEKQTQEIETNSLITKARKYGSAEEFVNAVVGGKISPKDMRAMGLKVSEGTKLLPGKIDLPKGIDSLEDFYNQAKGTGTDLMSEAKKPKSAEEFVGKQKGIKAFHSTDMPVDTKFSGNTQFTTDKSLFRSRGKNQVEAYIDLKNPYKSTTLEHPSFDELAKQGYDGYINRTGKIVIPFNENAIKTKSQLTNIYNQAKGTTKPTKKPTKKIDLDQDPQKKFDERGKEKQPLIKKGKGAIFDRVYDQLRLETNVEDNFNSIALRDQAKKATNFMEKNPKDAIAVSLRQQAPPAGVTFNAINIATSKQALANGELQLYTDLVSARSIIVSRSAQSLGLERLVNSLSTDTFVQEVFRSRIQKLSTKGGFVSKFKASFKKGGKISLGLDIISDSATNLKKSIDTKVKKKIASAQEIIDKLTCK